MGNIKNTKINGIFAVSAVAIIISIWYGCGFFFQIDNFFGILIILFEVSMFVYLPRIKECRQRGIKVLMVMIVVAASSFSIFGVVANSYNTISKSNKANYASEVNPKYTEYTENKKQLEANLASLNKSLNEYPALETRVSQLKDWENKADTMKDWQKGKTKIESNIKEISDKMTAAKMPDKTITTRKSFSGYDGIFGNIAEIIGTKETTLTIALSFIIATILQLIIWSARLFAKKKNENSRGLETVKSEFLTPEKSDSLTPEKFDFKIEKTRGLESEKLGDLETVSNDLLPAENRELYTREIGGLETVKSEFLTPEKSDSLTPEKFDFKIKNFGGLESEKAGSLNAQKNVLEFKKSESSNENLIEEIENYITENYKIGDVVSATTIQENFKISKKKWENMRKSLLNIKVDGRRTYRTRTKKRPQNSNGLR